MSQRTLDIRIVPDLEKITKHERMALQSMIYNECFKDEELSANTIVLIGEGFLLQDAETGEIVSAFIVCPTRLELDKNRIGWYLTDVCTRESERGHGFMRLLLTRAKQYWLDQGIEHVTLYVLKSKAGAIKLYSDLGFEVIHPDVKLIFPKQGKREFPAQVMRLFLHNKRAPPKPRASRALHSTPPPPALATTVATFSVQYIADVKLMLPAERAQLTQQLYGARACLNEPLRADNPWHRGSLFFVQHKAAILAALFATRGSDNNLPGPVVHVLFDRCIAVENGVHDIAELTKQLLLEALPLLQHMTTEGGPLRLCVPRSSGSTRRKSSDSVTHSVLESCGFQPERSLHLAASRQWIDIFLLSPQA